MSESSILRKSSYYLGVSVLQTGSLLFVLMVSGVYRPFSSASPQVPEYTFIPPRKLVSSEQIIHSGKPIRIQIDALNIDTELLDGVYNSTNNTWTLSPNGVHYATASALANTFGGSTFVYGHNNSQVFGSLLTLSFGDEVHLQTDTELTFTYRYVRNAQLRPEDTSPLTYQASPPILTIQTCSGNWQEYRSIFYFDLIQVTNGLGQKLYG